MTIAKQRITSNAVKEPAERLWSNCLKVGDQVFISGLTARGMDGETIEGDGEYEQAKTIFTKMKHLIESAGGVMNDITKMTIFVTRMAHNKDVWRAREEFFSGDFPACSLVEVSSLAKPEILVEIEGMGILHCSQPVQEGKPA